MMTVWQSLVKIEIGLQGALQGAACTSLWVCVMMFSMQMFTMLSVTPMFDIPMLKCYHDGFTLLLTFWIQDMMLNVTPNISQIVSII